MDDEEDQPQEESETVPDADDKPTPEKGSYDLFHDDLTKHRQHMHNLIDNPHLSMAGLHAYATVMHHHMSRAIRTNGKLPHWYHPAKEIFNTLGLGKVGR